MCDFPLFISFLFHSCSINLKLWSIGDLTMNWECVTIDTIDILTLTDPALWTTQTVPGWGLHKQSCIGGGGEGWSFNVGLIFSKGSIYYETIPKAEAKFLTWVRNLSESIYNLLFNIQIWKIWYHWMSTYLNVCEFCP